MAKIKNFGTGTTKFNEGLIVTGSAGTDIRALVVTGSTNMVGNSHAPTLDVYNNISNNYVAIIDNDESSAGHGMKITSDGSGTGTYLLDIESGSTTLFRFRGDGRFGIGTTTPGQTLTVEGDIGIGTQLVHKGDSNTFIEFNDDEINIEVGGRQMIKMTEAGTDKIIINNAAANVDLQVKGENHANLLRTDAGNDRVGIATNSPVSTFEVVGSIGRSISAKTSDYTVTESDSTIIANASSGSVIITLPAVAGCVGRIYTIKCAAKGEGSAMNIQSNGSETIDGSTNDVILEALGAVTLQSDGVGWHKIAEIVPPPP